MGNSNKKNTPEQPKFNVLIRGTHNSGRSKLVRQLQLLYGSVDEEEEKPVWKRILIENISRTFKEFMRHLKHEVIQDNSESYNIISGLDPYRTILTPELVPHFKNLWHKGVKDLHNRRNEIIVSREAFTNIEYCMSIIDKLADPQYTVSNEDIMHGKVILTGAGQYDITMGDIVYELTVNMSCRCCLYQYKSNGGIYMVALDEWDIISDKNPHQTRLDESLDEFELVANSPWFNNLPVALVLNKKDIFKEKIAWNDLSRVYPEYKGGSDFDKAIEFIKNMFLARIYSPDQQRAALPEREGEKPRKKHIGTPLVVETYILNAMDSQDVAKVFDSITNFFLSSPKV